MSDRCCPRVCGSGKLGFKVGLGQAPVGVPSSVSAATLQSQSRPSYPVDTAASFNALPSCPDAVALQECGVPARDLRTAFPAGSVAPWRSVRCCDSPVCWVVWLCGGLTVNLFKAIGVWRFRRKLPCSCQNRLCGSVYIFSFSFALPRFLSQLGRRA